MSEPEIVHPVPSELLEAWLRTLQTHLLQDPASPEATIGRAHRHRTWVPEQAWAVLDRGAVVGTLAAEPRSMTLPGGGLTDVHAVTGVSVAATHRRRGLLRRMITESLDEARARGDAISALIAAEWPIYGRYGYAPATLEGRFTWRIRDRGAAPSGGVATGVRPVGVEELAGIAPALCERARSQRAGQFDRDDSWWPRRLGVDGFEAAPSASANWVVHETGGVPDGMLGWRTTRDFDIENSFGAAAVSELITISDDAYVALWSYLAGLDAIDELTFDNRPVDEPVRWLLGDGRTLRQTLASDGLWLRLLDVPVALAARTYATDGVLVLEVLDPDTGGYAAGRYALSVTDGVAICEPTNAPAQLRLSQRALASAYLGGHRLAALSLGGGSGVNTVDELEPGTLHRADVMFNVALAPWNQTHF